MSAGNRVFLECGLPDAKVMEDFRTLPAANVTDTMGRSCALDSQIHLTSSPERSIMAGATLTVKAHPGGNLMLHKALDMAGPGDVIVVSNEGDRTYSLMGEIVAVYAQCTRKVQDIVLGGPIRDIEELFQMEMFLYVTGSTPGGPYKEGPGEINVPISIGNITVNPGGIVLGDRGGIIIIPRADAAQTLENTKKYTETDASKVTAAKNGTARHQWVEDTLTKKSVEIIQGKCTGQVLRRGE